MSRVWRRLQCNLLLFVMVVATAAQGQEIQLNSPPTPVGSGARALGMGGAFIAIADDATAASWNPGGLTQLERPELSLVYNQKLFQERFKTTPHVLPRDDQFDLNSLELNFFSFVYPIPRTIGGRNLVFSLSYQRKLDFDRRVDLRLRDLFVSGSALVQQNIQVRQRQEGGLGTISPAFGFEITNKLSVGVVVNIWNSDIVPGNRWKTRTQTRTRNQVRIGTLTGAPLFSNRETIEDFTDYRGINYTLGLLYKPNERWSIGLVHHTKYTASVHRTKRTPSPFGGFTAERRRIRIEWPSATGLGVAYRFSNDKLTLSMDVTRRDWDDFVQIDKRATSSQRRVSPITNLSKRLSPHDPTWTVRIGGEYVFVNLNKPRQRLMPIVRAGFFYDPQPASGRKDTFFGVEKGDGDPDDYFGFSVGAGVLIMNRVNLDLAYQFRWGNNVRRDTLAGPGVFDSDFHEDVRQHRIFLSTVIYF